MHILHAIKLKHHLQQCLKPDFKPHSSWHSYITKIDIWWGKDELLRIIKSWDKYNPELTYWVVTQDDVNNRGYVMLARDYQKNIKRPERFTQHSLDLIIHIINYLDTEYKL